MRLVVLLLAGVAGVANVCAAPLALPAQDVRTLHWMSGCWERRTPAGVTLEQWMAPDGGTMLGMSRTVRGPTTREWEYLRMAPSTSGVLQYIALPSGQRETAFTATVVNDSLAEFENASHDFPQRIRYRRVARDSLIAQIGTLAAGAREITFAFQRAACAPRP